MADEMFLATLNHMLQKYAAERGEILGKIADRRVRAGDAAANVKRAQEHEKGAIGEDDKLLQEMEELSTYYNSLPEDERPQAILDQQTEMTTRQLEAHRRRKGAHDLVRDRQRVLGTRRRDLELAQKVEETISQRMRETNAEIERINRA